MTCEVGEKGGVVLMGRWSSPGLNLVPVWTSDVVLWSLCGLYEFTSVSEGLEGVYCNFDHTGQVHCENCHPGIFLLGNRTIKKLF